MTKKSPPEHKKPRKGMEKPAAVPTKKLVADRKERTRDKVEKVLEPQPEPVNIPDFSETLPTKTGLKSIITKCLRDKVEPADLAETVRLTLQKLSEQNDDAGRALDSTYWFESGSTVEIKNDELYAKNPEGKAIISGKKIKVVKPEKAVEEPASAPTPLPKASEAPQMPATSAEQLPPAPPAGGGAEAQPTTPAAAEAPPQPSEIQPAQTLAAPAEQTPPALLTPELIALLTKTKSSLQQLHAEFDFFKTQPADISNLTDLGKQVTALGDALTKLPDPQFQLDAVRLLRMQIAALQVEIEDIVNKTTVNEAEKPAREIPGVLKGLNNQINTLRENADTWRTEVECIARSSRVPRQTEINSALEKYNTLLLAESDKLREQINDIERSPVYNDELRTKLDPLKEQIRKISQSLEMPVRELHECLSRLPATNGGQSNVIRLRPVRSSPGTKPVNADGVFNEESDSWITKALRWAKLKK